ncbi:MAG TPA: hypothetical protein VE619_01280 [Nitrososphaeraceae archaeon]|nr:hypothetical protein [Nitrososphaeraceae archaeon]
MTQANNVPAEKEIYVTVISFSVILGSDKMKITRRMTLKSARVVIIQSHHDFDMPFYIDFPNSFAQITVRNNSASGNSTASSISCL